MSEPRLHHFGYVVHSVEESIPGFVRSLGTQLTSSVIHDPLQKVHVAFLHCPGADGVLVELVSPAAENSPVAGFLKKGGGLHHICYEVDSVADAIAQARSRNAVLIRPPKPAAAFNGRLIAWIFTPEKLLIEYLER